jgi:hypothetical protein
MPEINTMLEDKAIRLLKQIKKSDDLEATHQIADNILCQLLETAGYKKVVRAFKDLTKKYN